VPNFDQVHGNIRFAFLYFLGVYGGALAFTVVGGGHGSMVRVVASLLQ